MNKSKLARDIDRALKSAGHRKSVVKGMGWKGHGTPYLRSGFQIATKGFDGVAVTYYSEAVGFLPLHLIAKAGTPQAEFTMMRIRSQMSDAIRKYRSALFGFRIQDMMGEFDLPYILVTPAEMQA